MKYNRIGMRLFFRDIWQTQQKQEIIISRE